MERLFEKAKQVGDQIEVYSLEQQSDQIRFENGRLKDIESKIQSGISLRMIKNGSLGFAYTKNLLDPEDLVQQALDSLKGKVEASFDFPPNVSLAPLPAYDPLLEGLPNSALVEEGQRVCDYLASKVQAEVNVSIHRGVYQNHLLNSRGFDHALKGSLYFLNASVLFPGSQAGISRQILEKGFRHFPEENMEFLQRIFTQSLREVEPRAGKMKTLFLPETLYALIWRIQAAANGKNIYEKTSPLLGKIGAPLFDPKINLYDDPLNEKQPLARNFDDEGTPCRRFPIIEQGVLKNYYYDLDYAGKMKVFPMGHGFKSAMWGGETIALKPRPSLEYLYLPPGTYSFWDLVKAIDRGILVAGVLGAHSGNILNGDFSIGLAPGIYIEKGEIVGRVKEVMAAGNIYETLNAVVALEDKVHPAYSGHFPAVLLDQVNLAI